MTRITRMCDRYARAALNERLGFRPECRRSALVSCPLSVLRFPRGYVIEIRVIRVIRGSPEASLPPSWIRILCIGTRFFSETLVFSASSIRCASRLRSTPWRHSCQPAWRVPKTGREESLPRCKSCSHNGFCIADGNSTVVHKMCLQLLKLLKSALVWKSNRGCLRTLWCRRDRPHLHVVQPGRPHHKSPQPGGSLVCQCRIFIGSKLPAAPARFLPSEH